MSENFGEKLTDRRTFLKDALIGLAGAGLTKVLPGIDSKENNIFDNVGFEEIHDGEYLDKLQINNEPGVPTVVMYYFLAHDHIGIRKEGEEDVCIAFQDGQKIKRHMGEITNPTIFKVERVYDERVGVYPTLEGDFDNGKGRDELPNRTLSAIRVIGKTRNYYPDDGDNPEEIDPDSGEKYGDYFLVGDLEEKDGGYHFYGLGFVCDARALKIVG